jgi:nucleotide-binding universal stress UspA family protein
VSAAPTLVFGDDGSANAARAWSWVNHQPWSGWHLEVVTAQMPPIGPPPAPADAALHSWTPDVPREVAPGTDFASVEYLTAVIDPRLALWRPAELVVVGPRGTGVWKALKLGSTTEWLIDRPIAPVAVVRSEAPVQRVLVGHDGSLHAAAALAALVRLPLAAASAIDVVVVDDGRVDVAAATASATATLDAAGVTGAVRVTEGHPTSVILGAVDTEGPDLVVLGTRGLTGLRRLWVGSTAQTVLHEVACSVLVACSDAADQD